MTARRFEFRDAKSAKFWEIEAVEHRTITTWGRLGTDGQTKAKEFASAAKAKADADKKIAEKLKKGYAETGTVTGASPPPAAPTKPAQAPEPEPAPDPVTEPPVPTEADAATNDASDAADNAPLTSIDAAPVPEPVFAELTMSLAWQHKVIPRRDRPDVLLPLSPTPDPALASTALATEFGRKRAWIDRNLPRADLDPELQKLTLEPPEQLDPANRLHISSRSLAVRMTSFNERSFGSWGYHIVDDWVAKAGFEFTLRALEDMYHWEMPGERRLGTYVTPDVIARGEPHGFDVGQLPTLLQRFRHHLALAREADYTSAITVARELRQLGDASQLRMGYLFPTEATWAEDALRHATSSPFDEEALVSMVGTPHHLDLALAPLYTTPRMNKWNTRALPTMVAALGAELVPYLRLWLDGQIFEGGPVDKDADADSRKAYALALQFIGNEDAFRALASMADDKHVLPALAQLVDDRPHAAIRTLTPLSHGSSAQAKTIATLLRNVVRENPGAAVAVLGELTEGDRHRIEAFEDRSNEKPPAPNELVHPLLVDPPWENRVDRSSRTVLEGLTPIVPTPRLEFAPGSPDAVKQPPRLRGTPAIDWEVEAQKVLAGETGNERSPYAGLGGFFDGAPLHLVTRTLSQWQIPPGIDQWNNRRVTIILIRRLHADALPYVEQFAELNLPTVIKWVEPIASAGLAMPFADAFERMKVLRPRAADWLEKNADIAAYGLIPHAVGPDRPHQTVAANALRFIARSKREIVEQVAAEYGAEAQLAITEVLDFDEMQVLPKRMPKLPDFASLESMTLPLLADTQHQLPEGATANLLAMLAISKPGDVYPGVGIVVPTLDPTSAAAFGWELFQSWQAAGMPSKHGWVLSAQGHLGDDETVRQLTPIIRAWPGEGGHKRSVTGLDALADIGTDLALMQLFAMSRKLKFKGLKTKAGEKVLQIAEQRDLTPDQLADRLVPDLDLADNGSRVLDYGSRTFTVGFDEQLKPFVRDETGKARKSLPKPAQKDDPELAPLAYKEFSALKKDARAVAADQLIRLEQAMVRQRRWTGDDFNEYFVNHPLIIHLVRRLIWGVYEADQIVASFRVAEDRSLADANDDGFTLADGATVGIVHPLDMDPAALAAWGEVMSDYEMLQPFQQVARETFEMTPAELESTLFERFTGPSLPFGKYLGLEKRGWVRGTPQDGGVSPYLYRTLADGTAIYIELEEGLWTGYIQETPDQPIRGVWIGSANDSWYQKGTSPQLSTLAPVTISELLRDLTDLFG